MKIFVVFVFIVRCNAFFDNLTGPYFLWSSENLDNFKLPALQAIDEQNLREIYSKFSKIKFFIRNKTTIINKENFPKLSQIIDKSENWIYLPQQFLTIYPDAKNVEIFKLFGSMTEQDEKILEIFEDAQNKFGDKKVLRILATQNDMNKRTKREVEPNYLVYAVPGKILFYLYSPPELEIFGENGKYSKYLLNKYLSISVDQKETFQQLFVNYQIINEKITLGFNFEVSSGNWKMTKIFMKIIKAIRQF
ncbi:hypothetical protein PVAND_017093 [Polypedilum vanderplanki]|uniref:Uncharacterized protein n=1 Tax=Polypedilum vanderplanki TaxID=319348 RepID=A0A9J6BHR5_POLVA|nr:hypothetical protein PVAND_017093 [Polypedilum vanderplanki]